MAFLPTPPHKHIKDPAIVQFMDTFQDDIYVLADYPPPIHTLKIRQRVYSIIGNRDKFNIQVINK